MKRLALIGSREFAQQVRQFALDAGGFEVVGYFDDFEPKGTVVNGLPILGQMNDIEDEFSKNSFDQLFFAAGYNNFRFREDTFARFKGKIPFANIIMPSVVLCPGVQLGEGIFIGDATCIGPNSKIEDNVFVHGLSYISHDNVIGAHSYIAGRCDTAGMVQIGRRNFIGIRVTVSDHVTLCDDVWIGLACVVGKSIKEPGKYMSPAAKLYKIE